MSSVIKTCKGLIALLPPRSRITIIRTRRLHTQVKETAQRETTSSRPRCRAQAFPLRITPQAQAVMKTAPKSLRRQHKRTKRTWAARRSTQPVCHLASIAKLTQLAIKIQPRLVTLIVPSKAPSLQVSRARLSTTMIPSSLLSGQRRGFLRHRLSIISISSLIN